MHAYLAGGEAWLPFSKAIVFVEVHTALQAVGLVEGDDAYREGVGARGVV